MKKSKLHTVFKLLLGNGRAWRLMSKNIEALTYALVNVFDEIKRSANRIMYAPFLGDNPYANEDEAAADTENYERMFGLEPVSSSLTEREKNAASQWAMTGGQGIGYIESVLMLAGINAKIIENIPAKNLKALGAFEYGHRAYGAKVNGKSIEYGASGYKVIGNGTINNAGVLCDPVKITDWQKVFIVEVTDTLTYGQYKILTDKILQTKPGETTALVKVKLK